MIYLTSTGLKQKRRTVSVYLERKPDLNIHMFYCFNCRNAIMQYQGEVVTATPGNSPSKFPIDIMCQNLKCRTVYSFINWVEESLG